MRDTTQIKWLLSERGIGSYCGVETSKIWIYNPEQNLNSIIHELNEFVLPSIIKEILTSGENPKFMFQRPTIRMKAEYLSILIEPTFKGEAFKHYPFDLIPIIHLICPHGLNYSLIERDLEW